MGRTVTASEGLLDELATRTAAVLRGWAPGAEVVEIAPLTGGASSLTFVARLSGAPHERVVLKVAPPGLPPLRNRDVLRQGRLMRALTGVPGVRVPEVLFEDAGDPSGVPPFLAMSLVAGDCIEPTLAPRGAVPPDQVRDRAFDAARMLAALHAVDVRRALPDEVAQPVSAEIDRWTTAFTTVPDDLRRGYEEVADLLQRTVPAPLAPVVTHGDYRLGNTLCEGGRITSIIDWEIWSLGDPRIDVTWLTFFTDEAAHPAAPSPDPTGMPTKAELVAAYEEARGARVPDLSWFEALTKYKESAATALLIKRARKDGAEGDMHARMTPALPVLLAEAAELASAYPGA
jgi:aminoglycoside phosphotransferase (APT) family kinase protein